MAIARADLIVDTTSTSGTGTYTLTDPASPGGGLRTLADAVAAGHVTDGDTVYYIVRDTTTEGAALDFERGYGTVGSSGTTLTRTVTQSNNSDNEVDWPVGGSRSVAIVLDAASFGLLAAANTWTAAQTFTAEELDVVGDVRIKGKLANARILFLTNDESQQWNFQNTQSGGAFLIRDATAGTNPLTVAAGAATNALSIQSDGDVEAGFNLNVSGALTQGGIAVALQGVLSAPTGTKLLLGNPSVPAGWSIVDGLADRTVMLTSTSTEPDDTGGSWTSGLTAATTVNGHTLTAAEIPAHSHSILVGGGGSTLSSIGAGDGSDSGGTTTASAGSGGSHSHTASTTITSTSYRPAYVKFAVILKS